MSTWLLDTPLFNMLATPKAKPLLEWCEAKYPSGSGRLAVRARVSKGVTVELALRSRKDGWEDSRGRAPTALEQGRESADR
jgi:hypothetical protein